MLPRWRVGVQARVRIPGVRFERGWSRSSVRRDRTCDGARSNLPAGCARLLTRYEFSISVLVAGSWYRTIKIAFNATSMVTLRVSLENVSQCRHCSLAQKKDSYSNADVCGCIKSYLKCITGCCDESISILEYHSRLPFSSRRHDQVLRAFVLGSSHSKWGQ